MKIKRIRVSAPAWVAMAPFVLAACASGPKRVALTPGAQPGDATVDWETGSVTLEQEGVLVTAQGALLPDPRGRVLHPTFWVTVENDREERISVRPSDARLVDAAGRQMEPVPMSVDVGGREVRYALVDPRIRTYVSLHYGWPYYPLYPYPGWFGPPNYSRLPYWRRDPFWPYGVGPVWIMEVGPRRPIRPEARPAQDKREFIYSAARLTYVVVFPQIDPTAGDLRLIIPDVGMQAAEGAERSLEFDFVFAHLPDAEQR